MSQAAKGHKFTAKCPKCNYTSKLPLDPVFTLTNKNSVHSQHCPIHRLKLVPFRIPKK